MVSYETSVLSLFVSRLSVLWSLRRAVLCDCGIFYWVSSHLFLAHLSWWLMMSCCPSVIVHTFKWPPLKHLGQYSLVFMWSLLLKGGDGVDSLFKWSWSINQNDCHAHIWLKHLSSPEPRKLWGWILVYIIRNPRSVKFVQKIVVGWPLSFLRRLTFVLFAEISNLRPNTFVWGKCWNVSF